MTRADAEAARLQRIAENVPKVTWHRQMKWSFACPQSDGAFYADYPTPDAAYRDWKAHCEHQHAGLPVGWPVGVKGPPVKDRPPSRSVLDAPRRASRSAKPASDGQESLF